MQKPEVHSLFTQNGDWLGDFPNETFARLFTEVIHQLDLKLNEQPEVKSEPPVADQYDADRLGV